MSSVKRGWGWEVGGLHVSKEKGRYQEGAMKKERGGADTFLHHDLTGMKQNDPRETYLHISAFINLQ